MKKHWRYWGMGDNMKEHPPQYKEYMLKEYLKNRLSREQLAKKYGHSPNTLTRWFKDVLGYGVKLYSQREKLGCYCVKLWKQKLSPKQIGDILDIRKRSVRELIVEFENL